MGDKDYVPWSERVRNEGRLAGLSEGRAEGRERGDLVRRISQICKKLNKGLSIPVIAEHIEESTDFVEQICSLAAAYAPDYDVERIVDDYLKKNQKA